MRIVVVLWLFGFVVQAQTREIVVLEARPANQWCVVAHRDVTAEWDPKVGYKVFIPNPGEYKIRIQGAHKTIRVTKDGGPLDVILHGATTGDYVFVSKLGVIHRFTLVTSVSVESHKDFKE